MNKFLKLSRDTRRQFFLQAADKMKLSPQIVEKDFWVCWVLEKLLGLENIGSTLIFKGGTSLSKAYDLIERFSEDVDLSINHVSLGFGGAGCDPEAQIGSNERRRRIDQLKAACQQKIVKELLPAMVSEIETAIGHRRGWSLTVDENDPDVQTLLYFYPAIAEIDRSAYVQPAVKIEFGARSDHWPSNMVNIVSYVARLFPAAFQIPSFQVKVLAPERTFWEKATLLHAEYHRPMEKKILQRSSRHHYDMARLIKAGIGDKAVMEEKLLDRVVQHKKIFFQSAWAHYDEAKRGTFHLAPPSARIEELVKDYEKMSDMFFGTRTGFQQILEVLAEWETMFNQGSNDRHQTFP